MDLDRPHIVAGVAQCASQNQRYMHACACIATITGMFAPSMAPTTSVNTFSAHAGPPRREIMRQSHSLPDICWCHNRPRLWWHIATSHSVPVDVSTWQASHDNVPASWTKELCYECCWKCWTWSTAVANHSWPHHCCEGSAHALTAEMLIMQSHQDIPLCSLMTVAIVPKDCNMLIRCLRISKTFWARRNPSSVSRWFLFASRKYCWIFWTCPKCSWKILEISKMFVENFGNFQFFLRKFWKFPKCSQKILENPKFSLEHFEIFQTTPTSKERILRVLLEDAFLREGSVVSCLKYWICR